MPGWSHQLNDDFCLNFQSLSVVSPPIVEIMFPNYLNPEIPDCYIGFETVSWVENRSTSRSAATTQIQTFSLIYIILLPVVWTWSARWSRQGSLWRAQRWGPTRSWPRTQWPACSMGRRLSTSSRRTLSWRWDPLLNSCIHLGKDLHNINTKVFLCCFGF